MGKNLKGKECGTVKGIGEQDNLRHRKVIVPFRLLTKHIRFLKAVMMKRTAGKSLKHCRRF